MTQADLASASNEIKLLLDNYHMLCDKMMEIGGKKSVRESVYVVE